MAQDIKTDGERACSRKVGLLLYGLWVQVTEKFGQNNYKCIFDHGLTLLSLEIFEGVKLQLAMDLQCQISRSRQRRSRQLTKPELFPYF